MSDREKILSRIPKASRSALPMLPSVSSAPASVEVFSEKLAAIGGASVILKGTDSLRDFVRERFPEAKRIVSSFDGVAEYKTSGDKPHDFQDCDVAIISAEFGVAENGSVWVTDASLIFPVLPFITQHLVAVIHDDEIVSDMHAAYERIAGRDYSFATFLAGPSKTADIEQSLVLGAHGPKSMTVIILNSRE